MTADRRLTLAVVSAGTAMLLLDVTVVNVALPVIREDLDASFAELQWVIDAYALTLAATLLTAGALADRLGRRAIFTGGLLAFTLLSAACGAATSGVALDVARAAQGIGAAAMFAASLALLAHEFQGRERGLALGVWGAITGAAMAIGPVAGGLIVDGLGWRWVFLVNVPVGAVLLWRTLTRLPESRDPTPRRLDLPGLLTFGTACFLATFALVRGNADSWASVHIAGSLAAAAVLLAAFVAIELRSPSPMLDPSLFRIPAFTGTALVAFAQSAALYPLFLFLALYFQEALGLSPTETGVRLLPITLVLFIVAPLSGKATSRVALRVPLVTGLVLIATSLLLMRGLPVADDWTHLLPGFLVAGLAIGVISPALAAAMVGVLSVEQSGLASGVNNTFRQLGIDTDHEVQRSLLDRRRDDHLANAALEVGLEHLPRTELARALENDLDAELVLRHLAGRCVPAVSDGFTIDRQRVVASAHVLLPPAVDGIEGEQMRRGLGIAVQLVDVRELQLGPSPGRAHSEPTHAPEAVDPDTR